MIETFELLREGESLEDFTKSALSSFHFFETRVLGRDIAPHHMEFFKDFINHERSMEMAFRGSGKTTVLGVDSPLFLACRDRFISHSCQRYKANCPNYGEEQI